MNSKDGLSSSEVYIKLSAVMEETGSTLYQLMPKRHISLSLLGNVTLAVIPHLLFLLKSKLETLSCCDDSNLNDLFPSVVFSTDWLVKWNESGVSCPQVTKVFAFLPADLNILALHIILILKESFSFRGDFLESHG